MIFSTLAFLLAASNVHAFSPGTEVIPGQFIVKMPKLSLASTLSKEAMLSGYGTQLRTMGVQPIDVIARASSDILLINATKDAIDSLQLQGSTVYPRIKLKPVAVQQKAPWHLTVTTSADHL